MAETNIGWCDHSINPIRARHKQTGAVGHYCEKVAPGCSNCYASKMQRRFGMPEFGSGQHRDEVEIFLDELKLDEVVRRRKPTRYFWEDMSDLFGDWMEQEWLVKCFAAMDATPQHTHMLLTKRPENVRRMWPTEDDGHGGRLAATIFSTDEKCPDCGRVYDTSGEFKYEGNCECGSPLAMLVDVPKQGRLIRRRNNCWLLTSIANQEDADRNIPELLKLRDLAPVLGVSAEPLVGPVDLSQWLWKQLSQKEVYGDAYGATDDPCDVAPSGLLSWAICGGESGPKRRECEPAWIQSLADQCQAAGVPCFVKQDSAQKPGQQGRLSDDLWAVKQFPMVEATT